MKAAIYSRFSTERQDVQSIADQVRVCTEWAQREGATVARSFADEGISGAATGNRPEFLAMMRAAQAREFGLLLVMDLSRLSRSNGDLAKTIDRLTFTGIRIVGVQDGFDTDRDGHELVSGLSGIIGQQFRKMIARKTYTALESRAQAGKPTGGRAFGFRDGEAEVLLEIFEHYASGWSAQRIAADLNARGVPSPGAGINRAKRRRGMWMCSAIAGDQRRGVGILNNELYIGRDIWNRSRWDKDPDTGMRKAKQRPQSEWIVYDKPEARLISDDLWKRAKARQQRNAERMGERVSRGISAANAQRTGRGPKHLFSTLLQCGRCGANFVVVDARSYGCSSYKHGGAAACTNDFRVKRTVLEDGLLDGIRRELLEPEVLAEFKKRVIRRLVDEQRQPVVDPKRIAELEAQVGNLAEAIATGALRSSPALAERMATADVELARIREAAIPKEVARVDRIIPRLVDGFHELVADLPNAVKRDVDRARATVRQYVGDKILVVDEIQDGQPVVAFRTQKGRLEAAFVKLAGGSNALQCGSGGRI